MGMRTKFTEHPASVGETYGEHFRVASHFAAELAKASFVCAVHAVYPCAFTTRGSDKVKALYAEMTAGARGELATLPDPSVENHAATSAG